jgi:predicted AlkP superfamily pyrophosphatase or phosphodiesterase
MKILTVKSLWFCVLMLFPFASNGQQGKFENRTLIVFFDGLRPDYITREQMPNLFAFKTDACYSRNHHSVFPTVTRVNSSSYATGSYPGTHGLLGNTVYFPEVNQAKAIGTSYSDLSKVGKATSDQLLTAVSLGEVLGSAGQKMMVFSSGTTGQAFLQNHKVNGAIVNPDLILPESFKPQVISEIGKAPDENESSDNARHKWITDAILKYGLADDGPLISAIWFSDPDGAAHSHGIGSDEAVESIRYVDSQFGRIMDALASKKLTRKYNVIISTDHGFVSHIGKVSLADFLIGMGVKKDKNSDDVLVAEGAIYVKDHNKKVIQQIVSGLHQQEWVGAVFTKGAKKGDDKGWVDGTLSFDAIHYDHPRAGDILVAVDWNDQKNKKGFAGTSYAGGVAGHGGSSPYEIGIAMFAKGPDFKKSFTGNLPTSNVDITPTVLGIYNLPIPAQMDGRVVSEFFVNSKSTGKQAHAETIQALKVYPWGRYKVTLNLSVMGKYRYVNFTKVDRSLTK